MANTSSRMASFTVPSLSPGAGTRVADQLQKRLVSLVNLSLTLKHIHWNVVGPSFIGVHEMLDPQYHGVVASNTEIRVCPLPAKGTWVKPG